MKPLLHAALILALLSLNGCSGLLIHQAMKTDGLTPEQIKAYNEVGMDVYSCLTVSGPPPMGMGTWITVPKGKGNVVFGEGCRVVR